MTPDERSSPTVGVYSRPAWWRRRRTWAFAAPVAALLASLALLVAWLD